MEDVVETLLGLEIVDEQLGGHDKLFLEAISEIEKALPAQTELKIPEDPLLCITLLLADENGNISPRTDNHKRFDKE